MEPLKSTILKPKIIEFLRQIIPTHSKLGRVHSPWVHSSNGWGIEAFCIFSLGVSFEHQTSAFLLNTETGMPEGMRRCPLEPF